MTSHQRERQAELKSRFTALLGNVSAEVTEAAETPSAVNSAPPTAIDETPPARAAEAPAASARRAARRTAPTPAVAPMPIAQQAADATRPRRLMVPLSEDEDKALKVFRLDDGVPAAARIRAMLQLYREDDRWRRKVNDTVRRMR
jgi:hypothetical protein